MAKIAQPLGMLVALTLGWRELLQQERLQAPFRIDLSKSVLLTSCVNAPSA